MTRTYLWIAIISATVLVGIASAQKAAIAKQPDKAVLAQENVKELLLLMDADPSGKISKQEWMKFMAMEFDRFDKEKKGELSQERLRQSTVLVKHTRFSDLGK
jgi:Ca2+-binding EF-hand superfamily protein